MANFVGTDGNDNLLGTTDDDTFTGRRGDDTIVGLAGDDLANFAFETDGADSVNLGAGDDTVAVRAASGGQVRLTFTSSEVGNGSANDGGTTAPQDGGLAVRFQAESGGLVPTGPVSRFDDEGITFVAQDPGQTFDVRDISGAQRGDRFRTVALGTEAGDVNAFTDEANYVNAGAGNDTLAGGAGEDFLVGGVGNDVIDSVDRPSNIFAGAIAPERDSVLAGGGNDTVTGGRLDQLDGGADQDFLSINFDFNGPFTQNPPPPRPAVNLALDANGTGTANDGTFITGFERVDFNLTDSDDTVDTGNVAASLAGNGGDDTLTTGSGDDNLSGGDGDDTLSAGAGDDTISGGKGNDSVRGGAGDDDYAVFLGNQGADTVDLGEGDDEVRVDFAPQTLGETRQVRLTFTSSEVGNGSPNDGSSTAPQDGGLAVRIQEEAANGSLTGPVSRFDDEGITFIAGTQGLTFDVRDISGTQRGDLFEGVVLGTRGNDELTFFPPFRVDQAFYYNAGQGDDTVEAGNGNDFLVGGAGDDRLFGGSGDDTFIGGTGNDLIFGGPGDDRVIVNASTDGADAVNLGGGDDVVLAGLSAPGQIRLTFTSSEVGNGNTRDANQMTNQDGGFAVRFQAENGSGGLSGPVSRYEDEGITFVANAPGVTFDVRDLVSGVQRGDGFEVVRLGTMAGDRISELGETRSYYINAGMGDDSVVGSLADDFLVGGAGNDSLFGSQGNDTFIGGGGDDLIVGSRGDDRAIVNASTDGADRVDLGVGDDVVLAGLAAPGQIRLTFTSSEVGNGSADDSRTMTNQDGRLAVRFQAENGSGDPTGAVSRYDDEGITFVANAPGVTFDVRDLVSGAQRGDQFEVVQLGTSDGDGIFQARQSRSYYINAGGGDDTVVGGSADDFLVGGGGNDRLSGGLGNDTFIGGGGNDVLGGGLGNDTFIFNAALNASTNVDRIFDFSAPDDTIRLENDVFTGLAAGALSAEAFAFSTEAGEADDRIVYDRDTGRLFFDADGGSRDDLVVFARLVNEPNNLSADDFFVI